MGFEDLKSRARAGARRFAGEPAWIVVRVAVALVATSPSEILKFTAENDLGFIFLDAVSVTAVPEPDSVALMAFGLAAIAFMGRRRRA